jgi:hypothetical protein
MEKVGQRRPEIKAIKAIQAIQAIKVNQGKCESSDPFIARFGSNFET